MELHKFGVANELEVITNTAESKLCAKNAFYGYPMLSPTTRSLQNSKTEVISGVVTHPKTRHNRQSQYHLVFAKPPAKQHTIH